MTVGQARVLEVIRYSLKECGYPPTLREIATVLGLASTNGVRWHLRGLQRAGWIEREPIVARGIRLVEHAVTVVKG